MSREGRVEVKPGHGGRRIEGLTSLLVFSRLLLKLRGVASRRIRSDFCHAAERVRRASRRIRSDLPRLRAETSAFMKGANLSTQHVSSQADDDGNYGVQARRREGEGPKASVAAGNASMRSLRCPLRGVFDRTNRRRAGCRTSSA